MPSNQVTRKQLKKSESKVPVEISEPRKILYICKRLVSIINKSSFFFNPTNGHVTLRNFVNKNGSLSFFPRN